MTHYMTLNPTPFDNICNGNKTIELRLNDNKRKQIKINDKIIFRHSDCKERTITAKVTKLHHFKTFEELYSSLPLLKCGYTKDNISTTKSDDMLEYYSAEQQVKYGVLGIEFEIIEKHI